MESDIRAGMATRVTALGAGWGFSSPERLSQAGAYQILADPAEILPAVLDPARTGHVKRS
ncbi:hypothetical protein GCM10010344_70750 [Streptomyces bluensis]|nr:hypothetical protein GCM10010344_70750 [Streptomyces bluensis]